MTDFFLAGGVSMFPVAILGLISCVAALLFAVRPDGRKSGVLRALSTATAFVAVGGTAINLATVASAVSHNPAWAASTAIIIQGVGESLGPVILGSILLAAAWSAGALGARRLATA